MNNNKGKYYVGSVKECARGKGWFFGHFMDEKLLQSDLVDVSWKHYFTSPKPVGEVGPTSPTDNYAHYHRQTVEINIVIAGGVTGKIENTKFRAIKGQFYVLWPETIMSQFSTDPNTEVVVIRAPSIPNGGKVSLHRRNPVPNQSVGSGAGLKIK